MGDVMIRGAVTRANAFGWGIVVGYVVFRIERANEELRIHRAQWRAAAGTLRAASGR